MKPRLAWFSPLLIKGATPLVQSSTSAYVSELVLPELSQKFQIDLYHNGFESYRDYPTYHYLSAFRRHRENPYDLFFYQVEDGPVSYFSRSHIGLLPGVVYYHDILFKDEGPEPFHYSPWREICARYRDSNAPWPKRGEFPKRQLPFGARERALNLMALFSSERDLSEHKRMVQGGRSLAKLPSCLIPYPVSERRIDRAESSVFNVAFQGGFEIEHRAHKVLTALREFGRPFCLHWLISEGERPLVEALLREFKISSFKLISGRSPFNWEKIVQQSDVAIHSLFSGYGDPGPYLPISMMAGAVGIVTNFGAAEFFPDTTVIKIQPGESEARELLEALRLVSNGGELVQHLTKTAHDYANEFHNATFVARELAGLLIRSLPQMAAAMSDWLQLERAAGNALISEISSRWGTRIGGDDSSASSLMSWERVLAPTFGELNWEQRR